MDLQTLTKLIGRGLLFPFAGTSTRSLMTSELVTRLNQSLFLLFETPKGSRLMNPEYGSNLYKYRFELFDSILVERVKEEVKQDIKRWEPRVIVDAVNCSEDALSKDQSTLYIQIDYHIINTDVKENFVYPYRRETYSTSKDVQAGGLL